jgi:tRNA pseudouridine55 synthase
MGQTFTPDYFLEGTVLLIDKPLRWTSFQAVNAVKWAIRRKFNLGKIKVGHAGTLDPLATGLLLICTGRATKSISELQEQPKEYTGVITLGATTPSYDLETEADRVYPTAHICEKSILETASGFIGEIYQKPPIFSAIKKDGKRLYELARKGKEVIPVARPIQVYEFSIIRVDGTGVEFRIRCGKGTYIRSLAHDFGLALGSGAHLSALKRTKIGDFHVNKAQSPESFKEMLSRNNADS